MKTAPVAAPLAPAHVATFVTSGRALFTLRNAANGNRVTFKVTAPKVDRATGERVAPEAAQVRFVSVLTGTDNTSDYSYLGTVFADGTYRRTAKSKIGPDATSAVAAQWFFDRIKAGKPMPSALEVWHEGACCRCGRTLTVPESIESGIGPECAKKRGV